MCLDCWRNQERQDRRTDTRHERNPKTAFALVQHLSYSFKYFQRVSETLNPCFQNSPSLLLVDWKQQLLLEATAAICSPVRWKQRWLGTTDGHGLIPAAVFT